MIDDVIEIAFAQGTVCSVVSDACGWDEYRLARVDRSADSGEHVSVWVRPDGRFSRALGGEGLLTLGQVVRLCGLTWTRAPRTTTEETPACP